MTDSGLSIAVVGDFKTPEMSLLNQCLEQLHQSHSSDEFNLRYFSGLPDFLEEIFHQGESFPLILILQNRPREYSSAEILKLIEAVPLSRILCCYSSWCESDARNDADLWPVAVRVPVRASFHRILKELEVILGNANPLPLTASREETYLHLIPELLASNQDQPGKRVLIRTADLEFRLMLEELVELNHGSIVLLESDDKADICLWDADPLNEEQIQNMASFQNSLPETVLVPLMNFPQPDDLSLLQENFQITDIIPKLHLTGFLSEMIQNIPDQQTAS